MEKSVFSQDYGVFLGLLRATRRQAGLTQEQLARRLGQSQSFVSKCERGERRLDIIEVHQFCEAMNLPLDAFVQLLLAALKEKAINDASN